MFPNFHSLQSDMPSSVRKNARLITMPRDVTTIDRLENPDWLTRISGAAAVCKVTRVICKLARTPKRKAR